jgi:succinate dehydrogenase (ubiquinone) membrane anchor subunit
LVTLPLMGGAYIYGSHPFIDFALGIAIPLHCHFGFDTIIQDYMPARRVGNATFMTASWGLKALTGLVLYGCYEFNTNDIGLTALVQKLWKK